MVDETRRGCNNGTKPSPHGSRIDRLLWDAFEAVTRMELQYLEDAQERGQNFSSPFNGQYRLYRVIILEKYHIRALRWLV